MVRVGFDNRSLTVTAQNGLFRTKHFRAACFRAARFRAARVSKRYKSTT
jgi:hypothetical protein